MKVIGMMKRKPGLTEEEFRNYYENNHAPLALRTLPYISAYTRKYVVRDAARSVVHASGIDPAVDFDVITEMTFASRDDYDKMLAALADPDVSSALLEDEARFLDRAAMVIYVVDEYHSEITHG